VPDHLSVFHGHVVMCTVESSNGLYKEFTLSTSKEKIFYFSLEEKHQENKDLQQIQACGDSLNCLLLGCHFSREVWFSTLQPLGLHAVMPDSNSKLATWWFQSRKQVDKSGCNCFDCLMLLVILLLWKERNHQVFEGFSLQLSVYHFGTEDQG
jgi:hypothetical protein